MSDPNPVCSICFKKGVTVRLENVGGQWWHDDSVRRARQCNVHVFKELPPQPDQPPKKPCTC